MNTKSNPDALPIINRPKPKLSLLCGYMQWSYGYRIHPSLDIVNLDIVKYLIQ